MTSETEPLKISGNLKERWNSRNYQTPLKGEAVLIGHFNQAGFARRWITYETRRLSKPGATDLRCWRLICPSRWWITLNGDWLGRTWVGVGLSADGQTRDKMHRNPNKYLLFIIDMLAMHCL